MEMTESQKQMIMVLEESIRIVTQGGSPNGLIVILAGLEGPKLASVTPGKMGAGELHPMRDIENKLQEILQTYGYSCENFDDGPARWK